MQEAGLLVTLAEIAGVFVGFGALIAVRSGGASDEREVAYIRSVLSIGVWVVVVALAPATLGAYDIGGREVWLVSGLVALVGFAGVWAVNYRTREIQDYWAGRAKWRTSLSRTQFVLEVAGNTILAVAILAALVLVVLDLFPEREPALYLTAVVLGLLGAALALLWLVYAQGGPAASDEAAQPTE